MKTFSVKYFGNDGSGIPAQWISSTVESDVLLDGHDALMDEDAMDAHIAALQPAYDAWASAQQFKSSAPAAIEDEANRRVLAIIGTDDPDKKMNVIAKFCSILDKRISNIESTLGVQSNLTQLEAGTISTLRSVWAAVSSVRAKETALKARVANGEVFELNDAIWQ